MSTHATIIHKLGAQYGFDAMAKYRHRLEQADVTVLHIDVTLL